jgi:Putative Ig domain/Quinohemoprotein amine dehydrogenase, alpha subunit domain III
MIPTITGPASLPAGLVGKFYSVQFIATGGNGGNSWSVTGLPPTLTINSTTGLLSGTPTTTGTYSPTVTVIDNQYDVAQQGYSLTIAPLPSVTSTTPSSRGQGATNQTIAINGANFVNGAVVSFSGSGITVNSTTWVSATKINVNIDVASNATTGARNVTVTNPDTGTITGVGVFTVNPKPTITSTTPSSRGQGSVSQLVAINGTGFVSGATVSFSGSPITVNSVAFVSGTKLNATITIPANATTGLRDVTVTNPDFGVGTGTGVFTVNPAPTITTISPATHARNANGVVLMITGTNFVSGAVVSFSGSGITVVSTTFVNATTITVTINIANNATKSARDVTLTNGDGGPTTKVGGFTVT